MKFNTTIYDESRLRNSTFYHIRTLVKLLRRKDYVCKMKNILNDKSKFQKVYIDHDKILNHFIHMENRVTNVLKSLRDKNEISIEQYKGLSPSGSGPGIMYG